jgi:uncharacterized protein (DUF983 family)
MPVSSADRCPECGHERLLPLSPGACPECGFEYDEHTLIWRPRRPWRIYILFINTGIFLPWLARFLQVVLMYHKWPSRAVVLGALASLATLCWALPRLRVLLSEGHRFAAVTPRGVQARTPRHACLIPWAGLEKVSVRLGVPHLHQHGSRQVCELEWIFDTDDEVREFVAKVEAGRRRYHGV